MQKIDDVIAKALAGNVNDIKHLDPKSIYQFNIHQLTNLYITVYAEKLPEKEAEKPLK